LELRPTRPNPQKERLRRALIPRERGNFSSLAPSEHHQPGYLWWRARGFAMGRRRSIAASLVNCSKWRVSPEDYQARAAERDERQRNDNRDTTARYFGDPEPSRSALAQGYAGRGKSLGPAPRWHGDTRVNLWKPR
jgi:hypothetical protein